MGRRTPDSCFIRTEYPKVRRTPCSNVIRIPDRNVIRTGCCKGGKTGCFNVGRIECFKGGRIEALWITKILNDDSYLPCTQVAALLEGH